MAEKFGGYAKLREIIRVLAKEQLPDAEALTRRLLELAERPNSNSPYKRPVANDNGSSNLVVLEFGTVLSHVRFAEKLGLTPYRSAENPFLPGFEPEPGEYSETVIDEKIRQFLETKGISMVALVVALNEVEFKDIDSLSEALRASHGRAMSEADLKKCVRLLGDCGISLKYSRRKTYAPVRS